VSAPSTWDEAISGEIGPRTLTVKNVPARVERIGDVWADMRRRKRSLATAAARLKKLATEHERATE